MKKMTGMKKKIASLLLMLTLIMCQMPAMVFANDVPADVPPAGQQEQTVGQDGQNDQNGQPAGGQMNLANAGDNEEGTDGQNGDDVSKEQTTGSDASGTDETNGGDNKDLSDGAAKGNTPATVPANAGASGGKNTARMLTKSAPTAIENVTVNVAVPSVGATNVDASTCISIPNGVNYSIRSALWPLDGGATGVEGTKAGPLESKTYYIIVSLQTEKGYVFSAEGDNKTAVTVTGNASMHGDFRIINHPEEPAYSEGSVTVAFTPSSTTNDTANLHVYTPGHGKVLVNGTDYGTEFKGTYPVGKEVPIEAVPDSGYKLDSWWLRSEGSGGTRVSTPKVTVIAGSHPEAAAYFGLETAYLTISAPEAGKTAAKTPAVTLPAGAGYSIQADSQQWGPGLCWVESAEHGAEVLDPTTIFEEGKTYYAKVRIKDNGAGLAATAGGSTFDTNLSVTGGEKKSQANGYYSESEGVGYVVIEAVIAVTPSSATEHSVTINTDGLYTVQPEEMATQTVAHGDKATKPTAPKYLDHASSYDTTKMKFSKWSTKPASQLASYTDLNYSVADGGCIFDFNAAITKDENVYALSESELYLYPYNLSTSTQGTGGKIKLESIYYRNPVEITGGGYTAIKDTLQKLVAIPATGYNFVGWSTDKTKEKIISQDAQYEFTFSEEKTLYALFEEKPPVLTLHWSSVDGKDLMDPIKIEVPKGTTITQAFTGKGWTLEESRFTKNGYKDSTFRTNKPITDYTSEAALQSDLVQGTTQINADTDIYYIMYKEIGTVSGGIESPVCGTEAGNTTDTAPYGQTNAPKVSVPSGSNYQLEMVDSKPYAFWAGNKTVMDPFTDKFKGEESYYARFKLNTSFGYVFAGQPTVSIDNASDVSYQVEDNNAITAKNLVVVGAVKAVHDWGDWEVTKDPTETEEGLEERTCKTVDCGAHEERTIPKLVVEYRFVSGDGSSWTRGSTEKLNFVVKRNRADETTVDHFKGLKVDGKEVPSSGYAAKAGSVVIDLMPAYLGTLADGDHTLTAVFDDGNKETSASFKILSAADKGSKDKANSNKKGSPATGDDAQMLIWLMILCTAGLALSDRIIRRLKNDSADR